MDQPHVITVAISQRLVECLQEHHGVAPRRPLVLHDAAPDGIVPCPFDTRRAALVALGVDDAARWTQVCGYFGQLYVGRGIEVIEAMARARPEVLFLVYGGNESDIEARRRDARLPNLRFMGHVPHPRARAAMVAVDALLMPYQRQVSIGIAAHDTARWMSPMKMFEYLAAGVPLVSSDLPVLREVLRDGHNGLLVPPDEPAAWIAAIDRLRTDPAEAAAIGQRAHCEYLDHYSWSRRGAALLDAARSL
jgi:glycosyltransferase involved in cell wall biosynthesis